MMDTPGKLLKKTREDRGQSLEDLSKLLKVRCDYLKAIEDEDYTFIPGEVFIKGYMRIYAHELGIDSDHVLDLYKKSRSMETAAQTEQTQPEKKKPFFRYKSIGLAVFAVLIVSSSVLFVIYKHHQQPDSKADSKDRQQQLPPALLSAANEQHKAFSLRIAATEETWVSVIIDKDRYEQRLLRTGEVAMWEASKGFSIKIGNAAGAQLTFNGKNIGNLGPHGKVVRLYLPEITKTAGDNG